MVEVDAPPRAVVVRAVEEQAALRRVATLVARGVSCDELCGAVNGEVARLVDADVVSMLRFDPGDAVTLAAVWSAQDAGFPVGEQRPVDRSLETLRTTGRPVWFGAPEPAAPGPYAAEARRLGIRSSVGVPIAVDGRVWGATFASSLRPEPFSDAAAARIAGFTELVATAIANAQARTELQRVVAEQHALRRVATLVARGAAPPDVFGTVAVEASRLLDGVDTALLRYEPDDHAVVVAVCGSTGWAGMRVPTDNAGVTARVWRTGHTARVDSYAGVSGARELRLGAAVGAPIAVEGRLWGVIMAMTDQEPLPGGTEDRLSQFAELVAAAIGNAESREALTASRARIVATTDQARWRIQRDVHDGAQQRLVHTIITLKLARAALGEASGPVADLVQESLENAELATAELREVVRGIMPVALSTGGLRCAIESLVARSGLPVTIDVPDERLPAPLEATAYFIVAEALTNVIKHARATGARVTLVAAGSTLLLQVRDDGVGGADPRGSGLVGLADRVAASGGTMAITSLRGEGTTIAAELPFAG